MQSSNTGRILIISSYNGLRHETNIIPADMLALQFKQLRKLKHGLDKVVIVSTGSAGNINYESALDLFDDVLQVSNSQGSYGAWRDGYLAFPNYEWYFFMEDDYTFFIDDFDQRWIDMWTPDMSYLATLVRQNHAAMSAGLTKGDVLRSIDWSLFKGSANEYDSANQIGWSSMFALNGLKDISHKYSTPFWTGGDISLYDKSLPVLIGPMQMLDDFNPTVVNIRQLKAEEWKEGEYKREIDGQRHQQRIMDEPGYRKVWLDR
jgi:hypothetical protein